MLRANRVYAFLAFLYVLSVTVVVNGQGKQAIVVLRSEQASQSGCDGNVDLNYQILSGVTITNKHESRLPAPAGSGLPTSISRDNYEKSGKRKIRDLYELKWDSVLSAISVS